MKIRYFLGAIVVQIICILCIYGIYIFFCSLDMGDVLNKHF